MRYMYVFRIESDFLKFSYKVLLKYPERKFSLSMYHFLHYKYNHTIINTLTTLEIIIKALCKIDIGSSFLLLMVLSLYHGDVQYKDNGINTLFINGQQF